MVADTGQFNQHVGRSLGGAITRAEYEASQNAFCTPPVAQSPLSTVIDNLRRKVGSLEGLYDGLQQKLQPIIVAVPEGPPMKEGGITGQQSAVVMELSELEYRLGMLCRKIDTLISRIEV